jgi:hypothetical protein
MRQLLRAVSRQFNDYSWIGNTSNELSNDEGTVKLGCSQEIDYRNFTLIDLHARMIGSRDHRAYPSNYVGA